MGIEVEIMADSVSPLGYRLTTFKCRYWRAILAEVNTHRALSRNSPSSRAIPVAKMTETLINDPAMPVSWPKNQSGMQSAEDVDDETAARAQVLWIAARDSSLSYADQLSKLGIHKQVTNRLLEPWMWTTSLISATDWENFFLLRVHKDAQPDFQRLAYLMLKAYLSSKPREVGYGEWHLPFGDKIPPDISDPQKIVTGRAARISYLTQDGVLDPVKDCQIADKLIAAGHWSPTEHAATPMKTYGYWGNFQGWKQYRKFFPTENRRGDLNQLLREYENSQEDEHDSKSQS